MEVDEERGRATVVGVGTVQEPADGGIAGPPGDDLRFPCPGLESRGCAPGDDAPAPTGRIDDRHLGRRPRAGPHRDDAGRTPVDPVVPTPRHVGRRAVERHHDEPREPVLVPTQHDRVGRGRPREGALPGAPRRLGVVVRLEEERAGVAAEVRRRARSTTRSRPRRGRACARRVRTAAGPPTRAARRPRPVAHPRRGRRARSATRSTTSRPGPTRATRPAGRRARSRDPRRSRHATSAGARPGRRPRSRRRRARRHARRRRGSARRVR